MRTPDMSTGMTMIIMSIMIMGTTVIITMSMTGTVTTIISPRSA